MFLFISTAVPALCLDTNLLVASLDKVKPENHPESVDLGTPNSLFISL